MYTWLHILALPWIEYIKPGLICEKQPRVASKMLASQIGKQNSKASLPPAGSGTLSNHLTHLGLRVPIFKMRTLRKGNHKGLFPVLTLYESANDPKVFALNEIQRDQDKTRAVPIANTPRVAEMIPESLRR